MKTNIFASEAANYFERGYSALPVDGKVPLVKKWESYCDNLPKLETRSEWMRSFPSANIGLALGKEVAPGYHLGVVDVDDPRFVPVAKAIVRGTGPAKVGKKGISLFVLVEKRARKSTSFKSPTGGAIDILVAGKQTVIPPSIHPETGKPYQWIGGKLLDWDLAELPKVDEAQLALLKLIVGSDDTAQIMTGRTTHEAGVRLAAALVRYDDNDDHIVELLAALFPADYAGDSLSEVPGWVASARVKGFDKVGKLPIDESAARIIEQELAPLKFTVRDGFLQYRAGHWGQVSKTNIRRALKAELTPLVGPKGMVARILPSAEECLALNVEDDAFGKPEGKICLTNGTLDLRSGELIPHNPNHRLRYALDFEWDSTAECPTYEEQLRTTLRGDTKAIDTFEEFAGLTLVSDLKFQKAVYLLGEGGSGKSTLLKTIEGMHDPRAVSVTPLDKLDDERYRTDVAGKLVCITYDVQTHHRVFGETFVRITGGDPVAVRRLFKEVDGMVAPTVRFIGSMNPDMPPFSGAPDALKRRLIFLSCGARLPNPDPHRQERIAGERAGILLRWVDALKRLYERGRFDPPESSLLEVDEYLLAYEPFDSFATERLEKSKDESVPIFEVTEQFNAWAEGLEERKLSANMVGRKLKRLGFQTGQMKLKTVGRPDGVNTRVVFAKFTFKHQTMGPRQSF